MSNLMRPNKYMKHALDLASKAKDDPGTLPYAAVVVLNDNIIGEGINQAPRLFDPTSHGEVEAIKDACRRLQTTDLSGAIIYTTAEPCSMCVSTMVLTNISKLVYAADWQDSTDFMAAMAADQPSLKRRYNLIQLREQVALPPEKRDMLVERMGAQEAISIFKSFANSRK